MKENKHIKCDDCGKDILTTHIYFMGENRCWKCDEIFHRGLRNKEIGGINK